MSVPIGAVIIIIIDLIFPFTGHFIGGFVAGYLAKGNTLNAGKAGLLAGILAAIVVSLVVFAGRYRIRLPCIFPRLVPVFTVYRSHLYLVIIVFLGSAFAGLSLIHGTG